MLIRVRVHCPINGVLLWFNSAHGFLAFLFVKNFSFGTLSIERSRNFYKNAGAPRRKLLDILVLLDFFFFVVFEEEKINSSHKKREKKNSVACI